MTDQPKELAVTEGHYNARGMSIREMSFVANEMMQAKMFPDITTAHTAFVKIMAGAEMNIGPFQAMAGIHIIQGKAVVGGGLLAGLVKASPKYDYDVLEQTDKACRLQFRQGKTVLGVSEFTIEDARKAGTKNLEKFPKNMLFNRAMSNGVKWYCPDVTSGPVYVEGEIVEAEVAEPLKVKAERVLDELQAEGKISGHSPVTVENLPRGAFHGPGGILSEKPMPVEDMDYVDELPTDEVMTDDEITAKLDEVFAPEPITAKQRAKIFAVLSHEKGIKDPAAQKAVIQAMARSELSIELESTNDLNKQDANTLIDALIKADKDSLDLFFGTSHD